MARYFLNSFKKVCSCSSSVSFRSSLSAVPGKPIFCTVFQTSFFSPPPILFPVKFQNYIFFERRFIKSVARHYIVYSYPGTYFDQSKSHYLYPLNTHCACNVFCIQNNHNDIKNRKLRGTDFDVTCFYVCEAYYCTLN
jgi:hypothetical protein